MLLWFLVGIQKCYIIEGKGSEAGSIQTDGVNFTAGFENSDIVNVNRISANDVHSVLETFGVEAARATIVSEAQGVFGAYGIAVNVRHIGLVADYMTHHVSSKS